MKLAGWSLVACLSLATCLTTWAEPRKELKLATQQRLKDYNKAGGEFAPIPFGSVFDSAFQRVKQVLKPEVLAKYDLRMLQLNGSGVQNATATPDGLVIVTQELVQSINSVAEGVAVFILAHEVGHIVQEDEGRLAHGSVLGGVVKLLIPDKGGVNELLRQSSSLLTETGYQREMETEADEFGFNILRGADLGPGPAYSYLSALLQAEQKHGGDSRKGQFPIHPATADRLSNLRNWSRLRASEDLESVLAQLRRYSSLSDGKSRESKLACQLLIDQVKECESLKSVLGQEKPNGDLDLLNRLRSRATRIEDCLYTLGVPAEEARNSGDAFVGRFLSLCDYLGVALDFPPK